MSLQISEKVKELGRQAQEELKDQFARIDAIAEENAARVLDAFQTHRVADAYFASTTGYGYDDLGRDKLDEILKEHHRTKARLDLAALCRHSEALVHEYYRDEIARMGITARFRLPEGSLWIEGNEEQLGKILMSLISNSMYAVAKKYGKQAYAPEISLTLEADGHEARLTLKDNGTGIEPGIIGQVFDPFFTTKTTGEAAGVGLYLSREILLDHGGNITVESVPGEYTEFTITIPII